MRTTMTMSKLLSVFMMLDGVLSGSLNAKNSCGFPIYCMVARAASSVNPVGETSGITEVAAGGTYTSTGDFAAANDNIGISLKCSTSSTVSSPYQLEVTVLNGITWYDLSALNGNMFVNYETAVGIPGDSACVKEECAPGATNCEWPTLNACTTVDPVFMYLCSYS